MERGESTGIASYDQKRRITGASKPLSPERVEIRPERPDDIEAIRAITKAAFAPLSFSDQTEAEIIDALRAADAMEVSLVAIRDDELIGHIAFSRVTIDGNESGWFGLGPVAVRPDAQRQGIGTALVREGLRRIRMLNAKGCLLLGDPAYYRRFGFGADSRLVYEGVPPEYFQILAFTDFVPAGTVRFHPGFDAR